MKSVVAAGLLGRQAKSAFVMEAGKDIMKYLNARV